MSDRPHPQTYIPGYRIRYIELETVCGWLRDNGWAGGVGFDEAVKAMARSEAVRDDEPDRLRADEKIALGWSRAEIVDRFARIMRNAMGPEFWEAPPPEWAEKAAETIWQNVEAIVGDRLETDKADIARLRAALPDEPVGGLLDGLDEAVLAGAMKAVWPSHMEGTGGTGNAPTTSWRVFDPAIYSDDLASAIREEYDRRLASEKADR